MCTDTCLRDAHEHPRRNKPNDTYLAPGQLLLAIVVLSPPLLAFLVLVTTGGRATTTFLLFVIHPAIHPGNLLRRFLDPAVALGGVRAPLNLLTLAVLPIGPFPPAPVDVLLAETTIVSRVDLFVDVGVVSSNQRQKKGKGR